ncbi:pleiotropic regulatory protein RsmS [Shewanella sp. Isolate11]|uniref:pleiotropic regulatory protein RsmS n=1 Tax=Shewanella sp. Isolate11 TaxID=2908530 RepID=UPI001EFC5278|nr:pleiotropic regulatory protein RsmS [Shewanella sp. Isolate11]MCG9696088.1 pleiotropic regulatory protein RsmS [Shewanella sp. Isolate11]
MTADQKPKLDNDSALAQASDEVKLAVDLIYLLETHGIEPKVALAALEIVKQDLVNKLAIN